MRKLTEEETVAVLLMWPADDCQSGWTHVGNGHWIRTPAATREGRASWDPANGAPDCFFTPWANAFRLADGTVNLEGPDGVIFKSPCQFPLIYLSL